MSDDKFAWEPYGSYISRSRIGRFMQKHGIETWQELIQRSTQDVEWFWPAVLKDLGIEWFTPYREIYDDSRGMPWTKWFQGGRINIVHNILDRHIRDGLSEKTALYFEADDGASRSVSYGQLSSMVDEIAGGMKASGIKNGDVVCMCMSVSPEAVAVMLAAMKIGAVCMQVASRLKPGEVIGEIARCKAKILFIDNGYKRGGREFRLDEIITEASARISKLKKIVVNPRVLPLTLPADSRCVSYYNFKMSKGSVKTARISAEHPALILFSSGTTGKSKAIVHTHGGALAQAVKEVGYAFDCREDDVFCWFTNFGWMMAPWQIIGALFFGASVVLYEGTHLYPSPHRIFELIEKYGITIFGFTPTAMRALANLNEDFSPHKLSSLRILGSTGEPLDEETWYWYFRAFGQERCPIMNIIGGTEILGCHLSPLPIMPQKPATVGAQGLGMDVAIYDDEGNEINAGEGHLVCRKPFPSMTKGFLGEKKRYLETYFSRWPGVWAHGDRVRRDEDGLWYALGREDDVIVVGGVKFDPSKIERALMSFEGAESVVEAAAIGARDELRGQRIVCFVTLRGGASGVSAQSDEFIKSLQKIVQEKYDPMARPQEIYIVDALPKNFAAKIPRRLIKRAYEGGELDDTSKLDNLQALEIISKIGRTAQEIKK